ncbi:SDR family oxidoreductase [Azospirillum sp. INR13]|uniref:SDR family NAD(P)-dependent oxidoreductase n=1 Tax=Azospirillum sp. INR13 TaxID=2596919 RepID=UPI0018922D83|nr:SDR family oxidoreductase [Azospirillum sp. INR13]MBF5096111.1 SDR family oxidoreductase [Azospirillum sp. INR13]
MTEWAVVTGGNRNIGAGIARRLTEDGFQVIVASRTPPEHDFHAAYVPLDLADPAASAAALAEAVGDRPVTRFVHNAAIAPLAPGAEVPVAELARVYAVNVGAFVALTQVLLPSMRRLGVGRIVAIGSRAALGKEGRTAYAASKAALSGLVRTWALELGSDGITVNVVAPGPVRTSLFDAANPPGDPMTGKLMHGVPVGFIGTPDDIAHAVSFFASDAARFVTGQVLFVCGGTSIAFKEPDGRPPVVHRYAADFPATRR